MIDLTTRLKQELWSRYGTEDHRAEWDGLFGDNGGKISQRFWEYFISIEMLGLREGAVVLDIGGGGDGMFARVLAAHGVQVIVLDRRGGIESVENITVEDCFGDYDTLSIALRKYQPTHVSCVSVLEHASEDQQRGIFHALEDEFAGERAVFTFEFHETTQHFEQQVTTKTLAKMVSPLRRYYLERIERTPLYCTNAVHQWYPLALRFDRVQDA